MPSSDNGFAIRRAVEPADVRAVQELWQRYWDSLGLASNFQNFDGELRTLPGAYAPPGGLLLVAWQGERPAGTIALRRLTDDRAEAKRLFVLPEFRGRGLARTLLMQLIEAARAQGYCQIFADSLPSMHEAHGLYAQFGFRETKPYGDSPTPGAIYLVLPVAPSVAATSSANT